jgi:hypothetical protein
LAKVDADQVSRGPCIRSFGRVQSNVEATGMDSRSTMRKGDLLPVSDKKLACDACGKPIQGEPAGSGLYVWTRGEEVRYEEPPLCAKCANAIGLAALAQWEIEEDEG